jgi:hypothetical protein
MTCRFAQFLAVCSASILAEALCLSSPFSGPCRVKRSVSEKRTSLLIGSLQPSTDSETLSDAVLHGRLGTYERHLDAEQHWGEKENAQNMVSKHIHLHSADSHQAVSPSTDVLLEEGAVRNQRRYGRRRDRREAVLHGPWAYLGDVMPSPTPPCGPSPCTLPIRIWFYRAVIMDRYACARGRRLLERDTARVQRDQGSGLGTSTTAGHPTLAHWQHTSACNSSVSRTSSVRISCGVFSAPALQVALLGKSAMNTTQTFPQALAGAAAGRGEEV